MNGADRGLSLRGTRRGIGGLGEVGYEAVDVGISITSANGEYKGLPYTNSRKV